jgi:hypothetical protein
MTGLASIRTSGDSKIEIVDQLLLPHTTQFIEIDSIEAAHDAIKSMKVIVFYSTSRRVLTGKIDPRSASHCLSSSVVLFCISNSRITSITQSGFPVLARCPQVTSSTTSGPFVHRSAHSGESGSSNTSIDEDSSGVDRCRK